MIRQIFICPIRPLSDSSSGVIQNLAKKGRMLAKGPSSPGWSVTKIISVSPLLNQDTVGVCGHLYDLTMGSVDNTLRFQEDPGRLAVAVPEIYALPAVGDRVVLNITDALIGQYEGGAKGLLQYSTVLNQLWFSRDPVALDTLALQELDRERRLLGAPGFKPNLELYTNAVILQLGVNDSNRVEVNHLR